MLTFHRKTNGAGYYVRSGERAIGFVIKREGWTVHGRPVYWEAYRNGKSVGRGETRKEAAALLRA